MRQILRNLLFSPGGKLLLLLFVVILLGSLAMRLSQRSMRTGDPLYDRLQQVVSRNSARAAPYDKWNPYRFEWVWAPDESLLENWQDEFGDRSDYWCLLMLAQRAEFGKADPLQYIRKAAACEDAGSAVHARLFELELQAIRMDETMDAWQEDAAMQSLIADYLDRFPDRAWVCYIAADHLARYGMNAQFVELMELGNTLPDAGQGGLFPVSAAMELMQHDEFSGDPVLAGSFLRLQQRTFSDNLSRMFIIKESYKLMQLVGTDLGMARGLTALMRRDLLARIDSENPLLLCTPSVSAEMAPHVISASGDWEAGSKADTGVQQWLADLRAHEDYCKGIQSRLRYADPPLASYIEESHIWWSVRDGKGRSQQPELAQLIASRSQHSNGNFERMLCRQEYRLNRWLLDNEVPDCQRMLEHLATFDFEHPEQYVPMGSTPAGSAVTSAP